MSSVDLIEVKLSDGEISKNLVNFAKILNVPVAHQIVLNIQKTWTKNNLSLMSPIDYFKSL